jgi:hypothetical protein
VSEQLRPLLVEPLAFGARQPVVVCAGWGGDRVVCLDSVLAGPLGIAVTTANEHEWDAAVSALAALESGRQRWTHDLHRMETEAHERLIEPCGTTHYSWPE